MEEAPGEVGDELARGRRPVDSQRPLHLELQLSALGLRRQAGRRNDPAGHGGWGEARRARGREEDRGGGEERDREAAGRAPARQERVDAGRGRGGEEQRDPGRQPFPVAEAPERRQVPRQLPEAAVWPHGHPGEEGRREAEPARAARRRSAEPRQRRHRESQVLGEDPGLAGPGVPRVGHVEAGSERRAGRCEEPRDDQLEEPHREEVAALVLDPCQLVAAGRVREPRQHGEDEWCGGDEGGRHRRGPAPGGRAWARRARRHQDGVGDDAEHGEPPALRIAPGGGQGRGAPDQGEAARPAMLHEAVDGGEDPGKRGERGEVGDVVARGDEEARQRVGEPGGERGVPAPPEAPGPEPGAQARREVGEQHPELEAQVEGQHHEEQVERVLHRVHRVRDQRSAESRVRVPLRELTPAHLARDVALHRKVHAAVVAIGELPCGEESRREEDGQGRGQDEQGPQGAVRQPARRRGRHGGLGRHGGGPPVPRPRLRAAAQAASARSPAAVMPHPARRNGVR